MNPPTQSLQILVHKVDGSVFNFSQGEAGLANRFLNEFQPARMFNHGDITIADNHSVTTFNPSLVTRVDLITDQLSVWDFPFVVGALRELTEAEFYEFHHKRQRWMQPHPSGDSAISLEIEMLNSQRSFLWMEVIAGFPAGQLPMAFSVLKERNVIFGLPICGIGVLNPANIVRFTVHSDPSRSKN